MQAILNSILAFEAQNWQGQVALLVTQLPSIIVALSNYPRVDGFLSTLLRILNMFSFLTHADSPHTIKAPFTQSQPPTVVGIPVIK